MADKMLDLAAVYSLKEENVPATIEMVANKRYDIATFLNSGEFFDYAKEITD